MSVILVLVSVHESGVLVPSIPATQGPLALRAIVLVVLGVATLVLHRLHATLPPVTGVTETWWTANLARALLLWAVVDGLAVLGAVVYLLAGDLLVLALAVAWGGAMFVRYAPGRLTDG